LSSGTNVASSPPEDSVTAAVPLERWIRTDACDTRRYPSRSSRWSPTRSAFAMAVRAGFTAPMLGKKLVSTT